ncbi:hypothetical protein [Methanospirillum lacunae]|uniref:Uncharacterized protein n=1 Tax=Methanospirillum lacunae TaxID=668570 RepID=A0A2V2N7L5_9EURY|nr:hypothetical protein [Methanospirillum lacunae]PWR73696.1 hypothetical protein DK846_00550 [Methanospirillum lacunae]
MTRSDVIKAVLVFILILLVIPLALAEPMTVTVTTTDGPKSWSPQDETPGSYISVTKTGSSDITTSGEVITYGIAEAIGKGTESIVIVKIYNNSEMADPNKPGVLQVLNPGEERYFSDQITKGQTEQYVRVSWNQPSALNLSIYTPDGEYGPYHDDTDGKEDQTIFLKIDSPEGLDPGRWYYRVHGDQLQNPIPFQIETWRK